MNEMRCADTLEVRVLREEAHREPPVHEPVVHDEVGEAEEGHPDADADQDCADRPRDELTAPDDEAHRDRRMERGEYVVSLEPARSRGMMGGVDAPHRSVPDPSVEDARPRLHQACGHDGAEDAEYDRARHGSPLP